ncbi:MAG: phage portal protein [Deltaproteobacteria bacterium]|nr:phage portal protein [Deltaproteobacteria bacterium]
MIKNILRRFGYHKLQKRTAFKGGTNSNLYSGWTTNSNSLDTDLRSNLRALRARSRELTYNNDYAKKFIRMVKTNVIGQHGIKFQSRAVTQKGKPDEEARKRIEEQYNKWCEKGQCDVTGQLSFRDIQDLFISSTARDGEIIARKVSGFNNKHNYALQLIESDHLDENFNEIRANGNKIKMGIEFDKWNRPTVYHLYATHPGDTLFGSYSYGEKTPIPANQIVHGFTRQRISQSRGLPWMHSALTTYNMLGGYQEAELTAARLAASKMGFYVSKEGTQFTGDDNDGDTPISEATPGHFEVLNNGMDFKAFDPDHPTTAYKDFVKSILRSIASGVDVSYNYLANDLEGVNYSSIRAGVLDERDVWMALQRWMIEHFNNHIFKSWLSIQLINGNLKNMMLQDFNRYSSAHWQPRRWQWVDPVKDIAAKTKEIETGINAPSNIVAEMGQDYEEVLQQIAHDEKLRKQYGVKTNYDLEILEAAQKLSDQGDKQ